LRTSLLGTGILLVGVVVFYSTTRRGRELGSGSTRA